jgi:glycosyltransferase involved in cell wall biosynthesis
MPKKKDKKDKKETEKEKEKIIGPLLELVMIVKNSGDILGECLLRNKKYIDYWTILDTGSTDNTPDIIREAMVGVPGELHFSDFTTFAETRNKAFDLAQKKCKYMIVLDDSYEIFNGEKLRAYLEKSNADAIYPKIGIVKEGTFLESYYSDRITKTSSGIRYKYRVHEVPNLLPKHKKEYIDKPEEAFYIIDHKDDNQIKRTQARFQNDIRNLLLDQIDYPGDPRIVYYLAHTNFLLKDIKEAIRYNKMLLKMTHDDEYVFYAENSLVTLEMDNEEITTEIFRKKLQKIQNRHMNRAEPSYKLAVSFYEEGNLEKIEQIVNNLIKCPAPDVNKTTFEYDIYDYSIPYLYCEVKCKLGKFQEAVPILQNLLSIYPNDQKLLNMKYAICDNLTISSTRLAPKTMAIHTGNLPFDWDPDVTKPGQKISGSEYMAIYMAREFRDLGYRVFVFGSFENIKKKIDNQKTIEGIQYIDVSFFSNFCLTYIVDVLIVSRQLGNLAYYENIKSVYLWLHDILPVGDFRFIQMHREKFKGMICVSEWQKRYTMKHTKLDEHFFHVSRNAIHPKRFLQQSIEPIERTPFRFIFTSDPNRGFSNLVEMIPWIKERYPTSTFYMFGKSDQVNEKDRKSIDKLHETYQHQPFIFLRPRILQDELVKELQKSDIWLYPTCFEETYCISAVEAMASGCLVVAFSYAALCEVVGDRGVTVDLNSENRDRANRQLFDEMCNVLDDPQKKREITERGYEWALKQDFHSLALDWKKRFFTA